MSLVIQDGTVSEVLADQSLASDWVYSDLDKVSKRDLVVGLMVYDYCSEVVLLARVLETQFWMVFDLIDQDQLGGT